MREVKIASEPETLVRYFDELELCAAALGWRPVHCRNGCMPGLWPPDAMRFCSRRGT